MMLENDNVSMMLENNYVIMMQCLLLMLENKSQIVIPAFKWRRIEKITMSNKNTKPSPFSQLANYNLACYTNPIPKHKKNKKSISSAKSKLHPSPSNAHWKMYKMPRFLGLKDQTLLLFLQASLFFSRLPQENKILDEIWKPRPIHSWVLKMFYLIQWIEDAWFHPLDWPWVSIVG